MKASLWFAALLVASVARATGPAAVDRIVLPGGVVPTHYDVRISPDPAQRTFTGSAAIDVEVSKPTSEIVLNAAELAFSSVTLAGMAGSPAVAFDSQRETATLKFADPVTAGKHVLTIVYSGKINQHAAGLFGLEYSTPQGKKQALFTQFENSDARRFMPCWDEPARKATFTLVATVPANDMAVSNTPIESTEALPGGLKRVHFAVSPQMSTYLLFFAAGDFERVVRKVNNVDVGIVVKRGDADKAQFALDAAAHLLPFYEDYFGATFPLPKLDLIAGPGDSQFFGAMENWGAIFYFEQDLLIDPKISTEADRRGVYLVIAHEMAHQWFGDLVTMAWWDDLWLNEGFASWMQNKATDHFHPEWELGLDAQNAKESAMRIDSRLGTHPIIQPIRDVLQANQAFDTITYQKGAAVISMLEEYLGPDAFRAGVRSYINAHAYGNTVTDDLWHELDKTSGTPITAIAHDFTLQAGVPLIRVTTTGNGIRLTEDRFRVDASGDAKVSWRVPVLARRLGSTQVWRGVVRSGKPTDIAEVARGAVVNAGQAGYFRTLYSPAALRPLVAQFHQLSSEDELALLNDSLVLGYSGYAPLTDFLELGSLATPDMDPAVLDSLAVRLRGIDLVYDDLPGQAAFRQYCRQVLRPIFATVGWTGKPGERQNTTLLRETLLGALSQFDDDAIVSEARTRFAAFLHDPASLSGDLRRNVLTIVATHADAATWGQLHELAKGAGSALEKQDLYALLGFVRTPDLANRTMQLVLSDEVPYTSRPSILGSVSTYHPDMAFDFAAAHFDKLYAMLEPDSRNQFAPRLVAGSHNRAMIAKLRAYAEAHIPADARQEVVKAESTIAYYADIRARRLPDVDRWLSARPQAVDQSRRTAVDRIARQSLRNPGTSHQ